MRNGCKPGCDCSPGGNPVITTPDGRTVAVQTAAGRGVPLCWGIAGNFITLGAGVAQAPITITIRNYSWLKPRRLAMTVQDPLGVFVGNAAAAVVVNSVQGLGRQVIGSSAGIIAGSIDAYADRSLTFGRDISPITSSNDITVVVSNLTGVDFIVAATIEGEAQQ